MSKYNTKQTISLTFSDVAENGPGMQQLGKLAPNGFSKSDLESMQKNFPNSYIVDLSYNSHYAGVLVCPNGCDYILKNTKWTVDDLLDEQSNLTPDKYALMNGQVKYKWQRYNLCFDTTSQTADIKNGKGTVVAFNDVPITQYIQQNLQNFCTEKATDMKLEGNYYYDITKSFIGYHGDRERRRVICARLGAKFPLYYKRFYRGKQVGDTVTLMLNHGDMYVMSELAVGYNNKGAEYYMLHAAGYNIK